MTPRIPEKVLTWLVDWSLVAITDNTWPPRDPNDDDDEDEKTKRMRVGTKNRRSCANQTMNSRPGMRQLNKSAIGF
jgi:hypothetical protein